MDATFVQGLLRQEGIEASVQGQALRSAFGGVPMDALPSVWVEEKDVARAAPIIEAYRRTDRANADEADAERPRTTWSCPNCGERVEEQFSQCWKCGHQRPASPVAEA
jgi:predicted RNA-binding Zn-ribbon protein involved in translation (DUF1610 family)